MPDEWRRVASILTNHTFEDESFRSSPTMYRLVAPAYGTKALLLDTTTSGARAGVGVAVGVCVLVRVAAGVGVWVGDDVAVGVAVGVGVGVGEGARPNSFMSRGR